MLLILCAACDRTQNPQAVEKGAAVEQTDAEVTANVRMALAREESLQRADITVETLNGDVKLTGVLDNQTFIDHARDIARSAQGVHAIHNHLVVKGAGQ